MDDLLLKILKGIGLNNHDRRKTMRLAERIENGYIVMHIKKGKIVSINTAKQFTISPGVDAED